MRIIIIKKIYLIDNLKINILINIDLIKLKKININIFNKTIYIDSCNVIVSLNVRTFKIIVQTSIHARKTTTISFRFKIVLSIYYTIIFIDCDFFSSLKN